LTTGLSSTALGREGQTHLADIGLEGLVVINAVGGCYLGVRLLAELDLLRRGVHHELFLARDGIDGAGDGRGGDQNEYGDLCPGHLFALLISK
jgi:hypothetical protein